MPASAVEADHERTRISWVADAGGTRWEGHQQVDCVSIAEASTLPVIGDTFSRVRRALAGDYSDLLLGDGVSVAVERDATKGYGNAIVPEIQAEFVKAYMEIAA